MWRASAESFGGLACCFLPRTRSGQSACPSGPGSVTFEFSPAFTSILSGATTFVTMAFGQESQEYHLLRSSDEEPPESTRSRIRMGSSPSNSFLSLPSWPRLGTALGVLLLVVLSFALGRQSKESRGTQSLSPYSEFTPMSKHRIELTKCKHLLVRLAFDQPDQLWWNTNFSSETASARDLDELWDTQIPWETGIIALTNDEARAMKLPESQPWPWDSNGKSIYIVNAHHILHCVVRECTYHPNHDWYQLC